MEFCNVQQLIAGSRITRQKFGVAYLLDVVLPAPQRLHEKGEQRKGGKRTSEDRRG